MFATNDFEIHQKILLFSFSIERSKRGPLSSQKKRILHLQFSFPNTYSTPLTPLVAPPNKHLDDKAREPWPRDVFERKCRGRTGWKRTVVKSREIPVVELDDAFRIHFSDDRQVVPGWIIEYELSRTFPFVNYRRDKQSHFLVRSSMNSAATKSSYVFLREKRAIIGKNEQTKWFSRTL